MKFKLTNGKGSVDSFRGPDGKVYYPGDVVDLPASYKGQKWLETIAQEPKPVAPPSKIEPARAVEVPEGPLPEKKAKRTAKKAP